MKTLKILKTAENLLGPSSKCPRCYGGLVNEWESEIETNVQRCVFCGYRNLPQTKNNERHSSSLISAGN